MIAVRAHIFNLVFYINMIVLMIICLPLLVLPRKLLVGALKFWARTSMLWHRLIVGTKVEVRHRECIPQGPILVASKHQSLWETFALCTIFDDPAVVLKQELMWIPVFGWYGRKLKMIPINRSDGARSLRKMIAAAREAADMGRQIIVFPEGTRTAPGSAPDYRGGIALIQRALGLPCLPVALNSGWFWPRRRAIRYPGTIIVDVLQPIAPGLSKSEFLEKLVSAIENACHALALETAKAPDGPPQPDLIRAMKLTEYP